MTSIEQTSEEMGEIFIAPRVVPVTNFVPLEDGDDDEEDEAEEGAGLVQGIQTKTSDPSLSFLHNCSIENSLGERGEGRFFIVFI